LQNRIVFITKVSQNMKRRDFINSIVLGGISLGISRNQLFAVTPVRSIDLFTPENRKFLEAIYDKAIKENWRDLPFGDIVGMVGYEFLGTPYKAGTLEGDSEICRVLLGGVDCVTFFETSLAIATMIMKKKYSPENLILRVTHTRYRGGIQDKYLSRLHYTSDWIYDNIQKGIVYDVTEEMVGVPFKPEVNFMSTHSQYYKPLKENPDLVGKIKEIETDINSREYYYIPKDKVAMIESLLLTGDIVAICTDINGLDYGHLGLIYTDKDDTARLLHASSEQKKVVLDDTISNYLARNKKQTGITILRPTYTCPLDLDE
jgi:N-acetylmuramoyl-L-alanine amidase-like protein